MKMRADCYGISFLYSGSFNCEVEKDQTDQVRLNMGVQDEMFEYVLYPESEFVAPEVVRFIHLMDLLTCHIRCMTL